MMFGGELGWGINSVKRVEREIFTRLEHHYFPKHTTDTVPHNLIHACGITCLAKNLGQN